MCIRVRMRYTRLLPAHTNMGVIFDPLDKQPSTRSDAPDRNPACHERRRWGRWHLLESGVGTSSCCSRRGAPGDPIRFAPSVPIVLSAHPSAVGLALAWTGQTGNVESGRRAHSHTVLLLVQDHVVVVGDSFSLRG